LDLVDILTGAVSDELVSKPSVGSFYLIFGLKGEGISQNLMSKSPYPPLKTADVKIYPRLKLDWQSPKQSLDKYFCIIFNR